jgi:hypothetical protein
MCAGCLTTEYGKCAIAKRHGVIARSEATKQSSAREARQLKNAAFAADSAVFD